MHGQALVLVVENNPDYLKLLDSHLKLLDLSCICAKEGIKALILAQTRQPNLIVLDIGLPDLNGLQVIYYLKRTSRTMRIPIIGMTSLISKEDESIRRAGADDCMTKPFNFYQLKAIVNRFLNPVTPYN